MSDAALCSYVRTVAAPLVDAGATFEVELEHEVEGVTVALLTGSEDTYRQLLGKGGRTADALRTLLRAWAGAQQAKCRISFVRVVLPVATGGALR